MKKIVLDLNGQQTVVGGPGPRSKQILDFIKSIPDGKYFDGDGISKTLNISRASVNERIRPYLDEIKDHVLPMPSNAGWNGGGAPRYIYGSKRGIEALRKKVQDAGLI